MRTVGFLGGTDKLDLILYMAKILTLAKKRVLLVDATILQKAKYVVPTLSPTSTYVTDFEGFDVAGGFRSLDDIKDYLGTENKYLDYDYAIIDIDSPEMITSFDMEKAYKICFVTEFDVYSVKKGVEILSEFQRPVKVIKVLFSKNLIKEENEYLDYLSYGCKVAWDNDIINFPIELGNYAQRLQGQIVSRIKLKKFSDHYKNSLAYLAAKVFEEDVPESLAKRIIRSL